MYFIVQRNLVKAVIPISSRDNGTSPRTHHHCRSKRSREKSLVPTLREHTKISLCYFGLLSEDESVSRVKLRAQTGGHDVTDEVIRFNFTEGLAKAKLHLHLFENLTFVDGNSDYGHIVALHIAKSRIHKIEDNPPLWFKEQFEQSFNDLNPKDL